MEGLPPLVHSDYTKRTKAHFEIDEEKFTNALQYIIERQNKKNSFFQIPNNSCVTFANDIARLCGIDIGDTSATLVKLCLPIRLIPLVDRIMKFVPAWLFTVLYIIPGIMTNVICLAFGGLSRSRLDGTRFFQSPFDFFNPYKSLQHHPWYVATHLLPKLNGIKISGSSQQSPLA